MLIGVIRSSVPQMSGGLLEAGAIETGVEERPDRPGQINVSFISDESADFCGQAAVGGNPGTITLNYGISGCQSSCGASCWRSNPPLLTAVWTPQRSLRRIRSPPERAATQGGTR